MVTQVLKNPDVYLTDVIVTRVSLNNRFKYPRVVRSLVKAHAWPLSPDNRPARALPSVPKSSLRKQTNIFILQSDTADNTGFVYSTGFLISFSRVHHSPETNFQNRVNQVHILDDSHNWTEV